MQSQNVKRQKRLRKHRVPVAMKRCVASRSWGEIFTLISLSDRRKMEKSWGFLPRWGARSFFRLSAGRSGWERYTCATTAHIKMVPYIPLFSLRPKSQEWNCRLVFCLPKLFCIYRPFNYLVLAITFPHCSVFHELVVSSQMKPQL